MKSKPTAHPQRNLQFVTSGTDDDAKTYSSIFPTYPSTPPVKKTTSRWPRFSVKVNTSMPRKERMYTISVVILCGQKNVTGLTIVSETFDDVKKPSKKKTPMFYV